MQEAGKLRRWALAEKKALKMTIDKMQSIGLIDVDLNPRSSHSFSSAEINSMFYAYLENFKTQCHKEYSFGSVIDIARCLDVRKA